MRMNQDERRFDFHGLGAALKRAREEKGWTQAYVAELVDRDSRTIMNIENKGQYPSFDLFVKLITMFDISVDQFIHADGGARSSSCRKHMFLHTFRKISLHVFTLFTSQDGNYFQNFCKKFFARIRPTMQFVEHLPIFDKQNAIAIAGRKSVMRYHENRC